MATNPAARSKPSMLCIDTEADVERGIRALRRRCHVMRKVHDATGLPPLRRRAAGFTGLIRIIIGQQLSVASANAIWARCVAGIKPMRAATIAGLDDDALRACGLSGPKIRTLRAISDAVISRNVKLRTLATSSDEEVHAALTAVSGIGPWTADIYILACLGRADAFAAGDLALQIAAQHAFGLDDRPTADDLLQRAENWRPWRSVSARLLWSYYRVVKSGNSGAPI
ncbi:MAG: DNA-3-methyladenine glycosylase family protein [Hyphomicrobiaceae bacterium]